MAFLTFHEMLPVALGYTGQKQAVKAVLLGIALIIMHVSKVRN